MCVVRSSMGFSSVSAVKGEGDGGVVATGVILWGTVGFCGCEATLMLFAAVIIK